MIIKEGKHLDLVLESDFFISHCFLYELLVHYCKATYCFKIIALCKSQVAETTGWDMAKTIKLLPPPIRAAG